MHMAVLQMTSCSEKTCLLIGKAATPERVLQSIYRATEQTVGEACVTLEQIAGIGINMLGQVNSRTGLVFTLPNLCGAIFHCRILL